MVVRFKRMPIILAVVLIFGLLLAGCGGEEKEITTSKTE